MKITIDTNKDFEVNICMDEVDNSKDSVELSLELPAIIAGLSEAMVNKFVNSTSASEKKEDILQLLSFAQELVEDMYKEIEDEEEEAKLYDAMVSMYDQFIAENNINESEIIEELQKCDETDINLVVSNDMARFVVIKLNDGLPERLLELGNVRLEDVDAEAETIMDAFQAGLVGTVLYDKAFGEDSPQNICRTKNQAYLLSDKLKKATKLYQECLEAKKIEHNHLT